jgi:hypothetical protein
MAFKVGSVSYYPGIYNTPTTTDIGAMLVNNGSNSYFAYPGNTANTPQGSALQYRSLFTHGYVAGGYKGSSPWRNVNKTWHATDITFNVGEQLDRAMAYGDGTFSDFNAYVHGTINSYSGASNHTSSYNLHTGIARQKGMQVWDYNATSTAAGSLNTGTAFYRPTNAGAGAGDGLFGSATLPFGYIGTNPAGDGLGVTYGAAATWSTGSTTGSAVTEANATDSTIKWAQGVGGWDTSVAYDFHGCASDQMNQVGYIFGGGTNIVNRLHFPTEIMYTTTNAPVTASMTTCVFGANVAYVNFDSNHQIFNFANQTFSSWNNTSGSSTNGQSAWNKAVSSKLGQHYITVGDSIYKISDATGNTLSTFSKSYTSASEENGEMGQSWGYFLGNYNGQQNNQTMKIQYLSDVCTSLGFASMPKGHFGMSSAACSSAAATITAGYAI